MALDVPDSWVRRLDLSSFAGDAYAVEATLAVPTASPAIPRFISDGTPVRWVVAGMSSDSPGATQAADTVTTFATRVVKLNRTERGNSVVRLLAATGPAAGVNQEFTEANMSAGDVFVLAVTSVTPGEESADFLWVYPTAGVRRLEDGVAP
jgi:hypothetical protein